MTPRSALPADLGPGAFSVQRALASGIGRERLRGRDLEHPFWGVRSPPDSTHTVLGRASAYATRMPEASFFSHVTAAGMWGIPLPMPLQADRLLDVSVPDGHFVPSGKGVRGHRIAIDPSDVTTLDGLRLTSLARTWCDLASVLSDEDLVAAGDFLLWRRRPASIRLSRDELEAALARFHGRRHRSLLVSALPALTDRADSRPESIIRVRFTRAGLPAPEVNGEIYDDSGKFVAMTDLTFRRYRVGFDYDGEVHWRDAVQWGKDLKRAPRIEDAGWAYVRGGAPDLANSAELIEIVASRLRARGWGGPG